MPIDPFRILLFKVAISLRKTVGELQRDMISMATLGETNVIVNKYVISDKPSGDAPRLMLIFHEKLPMDAVMRIHQDLNRILESGEPIVLDGGIEVFQLIDGKWLHLDGSVELEDAPIPKTVNFREFL